MRAGKNAEGAEDAASDGSAIFAFTELPKLVVTRFYSSDNANIRRF